MNVYVDNSVKRSAEQPADGRGRRIDKVTTVRAALDKRVSSALLAHRVLTVQRSTVD